MTGIVAILVGAACVFAIPLCLFPRLFGKAPRSAVAWYSGGLLVSAVSLPAYVGWLWQSEQDVQAANSGAIFGIAFVVAAVIGLVLLSRQLSQFKKPYDRRLSPDGSVQ
jgi:drug/metabolite transporter (DMT)-like permease